MSARCSRGRRSVSLALHLVEQLDEAAQGVGREQLVVQQVVQVKNEVHVDVTLHDLLPVLLDEQLTGQRHVSPADETACEGN